MLSQGSGRLLFRLCDVFAHLLGESVKVGGIVVFALAEVNATGILDVPPDVATGKDDDRQTFESLVAPNVLEHLEAGDPRHVVVGNHEIVPNTGGHGDFELADELMTILDSINSIPAMFEQGNHRLTQIVVILCIEDFDRVLLRGSGLLLLESATTFEPVLIRFLDDRVGFLVEIDEAFTSRRVVFHDDVVLLSVRGVHPCPIAQRPPVIVRDEAKNHAIATLSSVSHADHESDLLRHPVFEDEGVGRGKAVAMHSSWWIELMDQLNSAGGFALYEGQADALVGIGKIEQCLDFTSVKQRVSSGHNDLPYCVSLNGRRDGCLTTCSYRTRPLIPYHEVS